MTTEEICALYTRTSQEKDDAFSVDSQIKAGHTFAADNRLSVPEGCDFREDFTGKTLNRPELDKLMMLVRERKVTNVIVYAVDRLARKIGVADMLLDEFMEHGVKLWIISWGTYIKNTPEDRLRFNFEATFSDFERRKIIERTARGKREQIEQGIPVGTGRPPYGYHREGKKKDTRFIIAEEQAQTIRRIFYWYAVERVSTIEIMKRLAGTPTPGEEKGYYGKHTIRASGQWPQVTIYQILRDKTYIGSMPTYGRTVEVPPIVDPDIFAKAQERLNEGRQQSPRNSKYEYLMARRLRCKFCNYAIGGTPRWSKGQVRSFYYRCPSVKEGKAKPKCDLPGFRVDVLDAVVWQWVREIMMHPDSLKVMMEESQKEIQERNHDLMYQRTRIDTRLDQEAQRLKVLIGEYASIQSQPDSAAKRNMEPIYRQAKEGAERLFNELAEERERIASQLQKQLISDDLIADLTEFAATIKDDLDSLPFKGRRELIEQLGIYGELALEEGKRVIYIIWHTHTFRRDLTLFSSC
jgi:site-specific DNA recombinase